MKFDSLNAESGEFDDIPENETPAATQGAPEEAPAVIINEANKALLLSAVAKAAGLEAVEVSDIRQLEGDAAVMVVLKDGAEWKVEPGPEYHLSVTGPDGEAKLIPPGSEAEEAAEAPAEVPSAEAEVEEPSAVVDGETVAHQGKDLSPLQALLHLSAGHMAPEDVKVPTDTPLQNVSAFSSLPDVDPSIRSIDDLARAWDDEPSSDHPVKLDRRSLGEGSPDSGDYDSPHHQHSQNAGGPGMLSRSPGGPRMMVQGQTSGGVGELLGRIAGAAVSAPFVALSSAARHIRDNFPQPTSAPAIGPGGPADVAAPLPIANTLEKITEWKCERIEKAAAVVAATADDLVGSEGFAVWDEALRSKADAMGIPVPEAVQRMRSDPEFRDVKDMMDTLWKAHPDKVEAYREACGDFERNIKNVVAEFPNSDEEIQSRVTSAMKSVEKKSEAIPGYGENIGEYLRSLAERVREMANALADFMAGLARKLGGLTRSSDVTLG